MKALTTRTAPLAEFKVIKAVIKVKVIKAEYKRNFLMNRWGL